MLFRSRALLYMMKVSQESDIQHIMIHVQSLLQADYATHIWRSARAVAASFRSS